jgi:acetyl-CoA acetyltransferase
MATETGWLRDKEGLGVWEHRGKVALVGRGHSHMERRWDGVSTDNSLGAYAIDAAQKAMEDAGISPDEVDGVITCPGAQSGTPGAASIGNPWAPRPYFDPPYDSEDGLTVVTAEWLTKQLGLKNVKYLNSHGDYLWRLIGLAVQAVGDGRCSVCLVPYSTGNIEGRYHQDPDDYARGAAQWTSPWGWGLASQGFGANQYYRKYGGNHDGMAPFIVNQRRNGLMVPWGYYALHEPYQITTEDYLNARWVAKPLSLLDCDRPTNAAACYVVTTAERARDMKQKPVYVLSHSESQFTPRSMIETFEETEEHTDIMARMAYEGSGLTPRDIDVFNPYDGFALFTQYYLEAFQWHGVKRGEAHAFYSGDIRVEGPHPFNSCGGNMGTGRSRTTFITDCMEQLQGRAGKRQVRIKAETALTIGVTPGSAATLVFSNSPD